MKKNILFIDFLPFSGSCTGLLTEVSILRKLYEPKYNFVIAGCKNSILENESKKSNYKYYAINALHADEFGKNYFLNLFYYFSVLLPLIYICIKNNISVIHCNHYMWSIYANPLGFLLRRKVIIHLKDDWMLKQKWARILMKFNPRTKYIAVSNHVFDNFVSKYKIQKQKVITIYDGIDAEVFLPTKQENIIKKIRNDKKIILMMSRVVPERDIEVFIDTAALLHKKYPKFIFLHFGYVNGFVDDVYFTSLRKRIKLLGLTHSFKFMNYLNKPTRVATILRKAYLSIIPGRQFALPNTAIESMMCGTPVVAYNVGGNPEIIKNEKNGILIDSNSPYLFFKLIKSLLANGKKYTEMSKHATLDSHRKFEATKLVTKLQKLY